MTSYSLFTYRGGNVAALGQGTSVAHVQIFDRLTSEVGSCPSAVRCGSLGVAHAASDHVASLCHHNIDIYFLAMTDFSLQFLWTGSDAKAAAVVFPSCGLEVDMNGNYVGCCWCSILNCLHGCARVYF